MRINVGTGLGDEMTYDTDAASAVTFLFVPADRVDPGLTAVLYKRPDGTFFAHAQTTRGPDHKLNQAFVVSVNRKAADNWAHGMLDLNTAKLINALAKGCHYLEPPIPIEVDKIKHLLPTGAEAIIDRTLEVDTRSPRA